jgi:hypothetical protein
MRRRVIAFAILTLAAACSSTGGPRRTAPPPSTTTTASTTTTIPPTITTVPAVCGGGAYPSPWPDRPRYTADLTVDPPGRALSGTLDVTFTPDAPTNRVVFRLWMNGVLAGRSGGRLTITGATVDGTAVAGSYSAAGAAPGTPGTVFTLPAPAGRALAAGSPTAVHLSFDGRLPGANADRLATVGSNIRLGSVLPTLSWVRGDGWQTSPAVDVLAEAAASEVADWDVTVHVPEGLAVLATGDERQPHHYVAAAVRDFALTIGRFRTATATAQGGRTTVVAGVGEGAGDNVATIARLTATAVDTMAAHFGPYPYDSLTIAVTPGLRGGIEFPMHIQLGAGIATRHLVHEVGHQWFYGLVGNDQYRDPWLDEGLTNYAEARVDNRVAGDRSLPIPAGGAGHTGESMAYWVAHRPIYFRSVYVQGTQLLGAIADDLGGYRALDCGLARYVRDRAYTVARPGALAAAITEQTGKDEAAAFARFGVRL